MGRRACKEESARPDPGRRRDAFGDLVGPRAAFVMGAFVMSAGACSQPGTEPERQHAPGARGSVAAPGTSSAMGPSLTGGAGSTSSGRDGEPGAATPTTAALSPPAAQDRPPCPAGMVEIPAASFVVGGATPEAVALGSPTHVRAYCLDRTEVTTEAYAACVAAGRCTEPLRGGSCTYERANASKHPINCVGLVQAKTFCEGAGKRLPTEAEWESAAGAGGRVYPWGDEPPGKGVCWDGAENALGRGNRHDSCDVGTFDGDVSPDGVRDLGGNVTEWTAPTGGDTARDPNQIAARRGGTWGTKSGPFLLRSTSRRVGDFDPYRSGIFTGFRCAAELMSERE